MKEKFPDYRYPSCGTVVNKAVSSSNLTEEEIVNNDTRIYTELDQLSSKYAGCLKIQPLFRGQRMEHLLNQEV